MDQLQIWRFNTQLLIGIVACLGVGLIFVFIFWTALRTWLFASSQKRSVGRFRSQRTAPDGTLLPPTAQGLCDQCGSVSDTVYYLPSRRRLCENCFKPGQS